MSDDDVKDTSDLQQKYDREVERARRFEGQLVDLQKQVEKFKGVDLDKLIADSAALKVLEVEKVKTSGNQDDIDALLADREKAIRAELQTTIDALTQEKESAASKLHELTVVDGAFSKIGSKFNDDTHDFIKDLIRKNVDVTDNGFVVKDKDGKPRIVNGSANKLMGLDDYAAELAEKHPSFAKATVTAGGKQNGTSTSSTSIDARRYLQMSPEQRAQIPASERMKLATEAVKL